MLGLEMMKVEIVIRNGRRGCLLRNFIDEYGAKMHEEGGVLLQSSVEGYNELQSSSLKGFELIDAGFQLIKKFRYWEAIKESFFDMIVFDVLIGNQDRHPFNWLILFFDKDIKFSPIYDNGTSLGFRFDDETLNEMVSNEVRLNKYVRNTKVKAGLFERKFVKAKDVLDYIQIHFPIEFANSVKKIKTFDVNKYKQFIQSCEFLTETQKDWLKLIIPFRRVKILEWIENGGMQSE